MKSKTNLLDSRVFAVCPAQNALVSKPPRPSQGGAVFSLPPPRRRRAYRSFSASFTLTRGQQMAVLNLPEARRYLVFNRRVIIVRATRAMMASGVTLNAAATALEISASTLCVWLQKYRSGGIEYLRPKPPGQSPGAATSCRFTIFTGL